MTDLGEKERKLAALEWIPRPVRDRMDRAGARVSLAAWQAAPFHVRWRLARNALESSIPDPAYAHDLLQAVQAS